MIILLSWGEETRIKGKNCRVVTELNRRNEAKRKYVYPLVGFSSVE